MAPTPKAAVGRCPGRSDLIAGGYNTIPFISHSARDPNSDKGPICVNRNEIQVGGQGSAKQSGIRTGCRLVLPVGL